MLRHAGSLSLQNAIDGSWTSVYARFVGDTLSLFDDAGQTLTVIHLTFCGVDSMAILPPTTARHAKRWTLALHTSIRHIVLAADTEVEMNEWATALLVLLRTNDALRSPTKKATGFDSEFNVASWKHHPTCTHHHHAAQCV
ncbi:Aste57867_19761 [Aphanomyces stellatus]|uniref:Aste57867_19761 protein n=1 Tax=Aphanomyces stellatus TaxID=120398 RepID=A0A485LDG2_9STRA|nr:hypothetical protein As57867_019696 [Aphanomyces stellatus]VFT96459.1 Aste57867_19761 [Aphanomyces stellatus]